MCDKANISINILMDKETQSRIGINDDDVHHVRPLDQKLCRILEAYAELQAENKRLREKAQEIVELSEAGSFMPAEIGFLIDELEDFLKS